MRRFHLVVLKVVLGGCRRYLSNCRQMELLLLLLLLKAHRVLAALNDARLGHALEGELAALHVVRGHGDR